MTSPDITTQTNWVAKPYKLALTRDTIETISIRAKMTNAPIYRTQSNPLKIISLLSFIAFLSAGIKKGHPLAPLTFRLATRRMAKTRQVTVFAFFWIYSPCHLRGLGYSLSCICIISSCKRGINSS